MKKLLTSLSVALLAVILSFAFAGCGTNVSGKTYEFSEVTFESDEQLSSAAQVLVDAAKTIVDGLFKGASFTFEEDGTISGSLTGISAGYWGQDGKTVSFYATSEKTTAVASMTASGSNLVYEYTQGGYTFNVNYVKA